MATKDISDLQVLQAYLDSKETYEKSTGLIWPEALLMERTGQHPKVCMNAMERAERRGLIEYGVSLRSGWLTERGVAVYHQLLDAGSQ